ncbi:sigma 54-interacting transcriptional regulator [Bacillus massiliigorillae]|uniref:sigma 54-interacting transcriptional regulator n=1 Tax=Bacillus massiliigorillae TaxID=1243664 RepID=UPI00039C8087|nr:sigma 54-interacting transcriptional regulator [Bacillus massiliigorillae]
MELKKDAFIVFSDISLLEIESLLKIQNAPVLVMKNHLEVLGIIDENTFWRKAYLKGLGDTITSYINNSFCVVNNLQELKNDELNHYDYVVQYFDNQYKCFSIEEVKLKKAQQERSALLNLQASLQEELDYTRKKVKELTQVLNSSFDEIFVTDENGRTLFVSESCKKLTGLPPEAYMYKNIHDLSAKGMIVNSVTKQTMESKTIQSAEQTYPNGVTVFSTATPIFDEEGQLYRIVTNSRDITELVNMKNQLTYAQTNYPLDSSESLRAEETVSINNLITSSKKMIHLIELAKKVAPMDSSIFIHGETGVGKGVFARIIHDFSPRTNNSFVQVNCGAIPPALIESELFGYESGAFTGAKKSGKQGLVEMAEGGTLFLDEIGEMPLDLQVKILHLVQDRTYMKVGGTKEKKANIRIISATHKDLKKLIIENKFREDLYYRLHVVPLHIPPLRERKEDILLLTEHFLQEFNKKYNQSIQINDSSKILLQLQDYPGNVRELENLIEQIVVMAQKPIISIEDLPFQASNSNLDITDEYEIMPLKTAVEITEKQLLSQALSAYKTTRKVAKVLQVSQTTIMRKLNKYRLAYEE